ncbi:uncharacterized protein DNG_00299 [Cephalotrichum gorgonifer]|uniref:DUF8004 domain-containing protein n=1 Tax=Cephalotrichum gorgonifer TaxID=2041049 RepID=A0AAE8MNN5_9PEZI|nr:uncharacterized protein DNG_00299 [Cephalotrichum gorgonifer]
MEMTSHLPRAQTVRRKPLPRRESAASTLNDDTPSTAGSRSRADSSLPPADAVPQQSQESVVEVLDTPLPPPQQAPPRIPEHPRPSTPEAVPVSLDSELQLPSATEPVPEPASESAQPSPEDIPPTIPALEAILPEIDASRPESHAMTTSHSTHSPEAPGLFQLPDPVARIFKSPPVPANKPQSPPPAIEPKGAAKLTKESPESYHLRRVSSSQGSSPPTSSDGPPAAERTSRLIRPQQSRARSASSQPLSNRDSPGLLAVSQVGDVDLKQSSENQGPSKRVEKLRRSVLPGGRSRANSHEPSSDAGAEAWVISSDNSRAEYNLSLLVNSEKIPELWNELGSLCVSLEPAGSGRGPSFRVPYPVVASSLILAELVQENNPRTSRSRSRGYDNRDSLSVDGATRPMSLASGSELSEDYFLHIPPPLPQDSSSTSSRPSDRLVAIRNLFAFLTGQPLVGTKAHPDAFAAFMQIASLLEEYAFTSQDGSSFGSEVDLSFGFYIRQLGLGDVRNSRDKTIQALILGERMRSTELYNEAFTHGVGKYSALVDMKSPLWPQISNLTRQRLDRAHLDLLNRQHNVNVRIEQFEFPSIFAGIANSTSQVEFRSVRFKQWKNSFMKMRNFTLGHYKSVYGSWPPKASSRKNPFSESGLNRLVLKALYSDMCALYDLLADRKSLTSRVINKTAEETETEVDADPAVTALRRMLSEFDNSSPPVLPPIPFDIPMIPTMTSVLETYDKLQPKEQARFDRRIKGYELTLVLEKSYDYNTNTVHANNPFITAFKEFEMKDARGKAAADIADQRIGFWLFMYVVIQSLPILVMDAPALMHTDGVEYFLCQPPVGNPPWAEDVSHIRKMWYEVSGGAGYVELAADAVLFSVEAIHHRSHCWIAAKAWEAALHQAGDPGYLSPTQMPPDAQFSAFPAGVDPSVARTPSTLSLDTSPSPGLGQSPIIRPRNDSPGPLQPPWRGINTAHRSSVVLGIEPVFNLPEGLLVPGERSSRVSSHGFPSHDRSSSLAPSPLSELHKHRSASAGNLSALANLRSVAGSPDSLSSPGATFDDILGKSDKKEKKRKTFFFA